MLWYLLKTWAGREEELVGEIQRTIPSCQYKECFVVYQERIWRRQQKNILHLERLFPGCVFLTCEDCGREGFPYPSARANKDRGKTMVWGSFAMLPMTKEDGDFLEKISGEDHVVRLSYIEKDKNGKIGQVSGPLKRCAGQVERYQFKKRYAMVRRRLWGEDQAIVLGIMLKDDREKMLLNHSGDHTGILEKTAEIPGAWEAKSEAGTF